MLLLLSPSDEERNPELTSLDPLLETPDILTGEDEPKLLDRNPELMEMGRPTVLKEVRPPKELGLMNLVEERDLPNEVVVTGRCLTNCL